MELKRHAMIHHVEEPLESTVPTLQVQEPLESTVPTLQAQGNWLKGSIDQNIFNKFDFFIMHAKLV